MLPRYGLKLDLFEIVIKIDSPTEFLISYNHAQFVHTYIYN